MLGKRKNKYSSGRHRILVVSVLCLFGFCLLAQVRPAKKGEQKPAKSKVYLLHSDVLKKSPLNPDPDAQILIGNVAFRHDSVYMYCDSACFYEKTNSLEAFDNVKMVQGDTLFLYGDYLFYDGNTQIAQVRYNVRMENKNTTLLTDSLNYDRIYNLGYYFDGGTLMDEENVLTSEWGEYSPATKISVFNYDVKLVNPKFTLTSDTLRYSTATKIANILTQEFFHMQKIAKRCVFYFYIPVLVQIILIRIKRFQRNLDSNIGQWQPSVIKVIIAYRIT